MRGNKTAILCAWQIYVDLKLSADFCYPDSKAELRQDLTETVERLKDFIVANSLTPLTRSDTDAFVQKRWTDKFSSLPRSLIGTDRCPMRKWLADIERDGREKRRAEVDKMLAVPRPPVLNPCL